MKRASTQAGGRRRRAASLIGMGLALSLTAATTVTVASPAGAAVGTKAATDGAVVISEKRLDPQTMDITIRSPAVGQDLPVRLLLPKDWSATGTKKYPVLMLLQGGQDNYTSWTRMTDVEQQVVNRGVIVVMPEAGASATYTNYYNDGKYGKPAWETFHTSEVLQILESGYSASTVRAIAGVSSGGYGSMIYSAHHPGMFRFGSTYSGTVSITDTANQWIIALITGEFNFNRWGTPGVNQDIWVKNDPVSQAANLKGEGLYISSGTTGLNNDAIDNTIWSPVQVVEIITGNMNMVFANKLKSLNIPATTNFYTYGQHSWPSWQREFTTSLPLMLKAVNAS